MSEAALSGATVRIPKVGEIWTYGKDQTAEIVAVKDGYVFYFCHTPGYSLATHTTLESFQSYKPPRAAPEQFFFNVYEYDVVCRHRSREEAEKAADNTTLEVAVRYIREDLT